MKNNQAFNEMMVHTPICTHKEPENVLVIGSVSDELKKEVEKHNLKNVEYGDTSILTSKDEKNVDLLIFTDVNLDEMLLANIERVLKNDGVISFSTSSFSSDEQKLKDDLSLVGQNFWIAMPYKFGHETAILASKKYHPTADIILQRSDLLVDLEYYSTEIHHASFVFPAAQYRALTGIARR
ncbi:spermidine synthase [Arcobacter sp. F155]|uniref:spermine/spermidine synthase domain-containing protein n=1 Tax=Arcobacter sp. F155 TaxID=2044512 RepID=UPI00100B58EA|nr:spermidine synthase [Arcobacter sp. F155]RXJ75293.1 spermidine synthase [Arcobacter sp. F155]